LSTALYNNMMMLQRNRCNATVAELYMLLAVHALTLMWEHHLAALAPVAANEVAGVYDKHARCVKRLSAAEGRLHG
jgi:hypothetical protein